MASTMEILLALGVLWVVAAALVTGALAHAAGSHGTRAVDAPRVFEFHA